MTIPLKTTTSFRLAAAGVLLSLAAGAALAQATSADPKQPAPSRPANTLKQPAPNRVSNSIQHGTHVAGQSIANADAASRRGIAKGSEAAARPVRNFGDSIGRKLGLGTGSQGPARGTQSEAP